MAPLVVGLTLASDAFGMALARQAWPVLLVCVAGQAICAYLLGAWYG